MLSTFMSACSPIFMIEPLPNCFSIFFITASRICCLFCELIVLSETMFDSQWGIFIVKGGVIENDNMQLDRQSTFVIRVLMAMFLLVSGNTKIHIHQTFYMDIVLILFITYKVLYN